MLSGNFAEMTTSNAILGSFKNPTASSEFEPANLGTKGQHATPRPPKPLPETCRVVIPIKLEFSASVDFIHKESVTMHGRKTVKFHLNISLLAVS